MATDNIAASLMAINQEKDVLMSMGFKPIGDLATVSQVPSQDRWQQEEWELNATGGTIRSLTIPCDSPIDSNSMYFTIRFRMSDSAANGSGLNVTTGTLAEQESRLIVPSFRTGFKVGTTDDPIPIDTGNHYGSQLQQDTKTGHFVFDPLEGFVNSIVMQYASTTSGDKSFYEAYGPKQFMSLKNLVNDNPYQTMEFAHNKFLVEEEQANGGAIYTSRNRGLLKSFPMTTVGTASGFTQEYEYTFPIKTDLNRKGYFIPINSTLQIIFNLRRAADYVRYGITSTSGYTRIQKDAVGDPDFIAADLPSTFAISVDRISIFYSKLDARSKPAILFNRFNALVPTQTWVVKQWFDQVRYQLTNASQNSQQTTFIEHGIPMYVVFFLSQKYGTDPNKDGGSVIADQLKQIDSGSEFFVLPRSTTSGKWRLSMRANVSGVQQTLEVDYDQIDNGEPLALYRSYTYFMKMMNTTRMSEKICRMSFDEWKRTYPCLCIPVLYPSSPSGLDTEKIYIDPDQSIDKRLTIQTSLPGFDSAYLAARNIEARVAVVQQIILQTKNGSPPNYLWEPTSIGLAADAGDGYVRASLAQRLQDAAARGNLA